jgi:hypothetical protein
MKQFVLKNRKAFMMAIAIYQVLGGLMCLWLLYNIASPGAIFIGLPIIALILISLFAGIFYFFNGESMRFFLLSKINFCAQLVQFSLAGIKFAFLYGFYLIVGADSNGEFQLYLGVKLAEFAIRLGNNDYQFFILNLFPLLPLIMLRWAERNPAIDPAETFLTEDEPVQ